MPNNTPNINLYKKDMTTDQTHTFNIDTMLNDNWDKIDNAVGNLQTELKTNINQQTTTLTNATSTQHITAKQNCGVDVEVGGEMVVNLLGDGNDIENYGTGAIRTLVQQSNGIQILANEESNAFAFCSVGKLNTNKYYLVSIEVLGNKEPFVSLGTLAGGVTGGGGFTGLQSDIFQRIGFKVNPTTTSELYISILMNGTDSDGTFKDFMFIEITQEEYNTLTVDQLLAKYPYTNSAQPLLNPTVEVCGKNLVKNGNGEEGINYWSQENGVIASVENNKVKLISSAGDQYIKQYIKVKPNTNYNINVNISGSGDPITYIDNEALSVILKTGVGTFNTGDNDVVAVIMLNQNAGTSYFDSIQLEQGTTPTPYEPYKGGQIIFPTELTKIDNYQDKLTYKDGVVKVDREVKHVVLDGSLDWGFSVDFTGRKNVSLIVNDKFNNINDVVVSKHNGAMLENDQAVAKADSFAINSSTLNQIFICISDTNSGWGENYEPSTDEIKAYFNGWRMYEANSGYATPYNNTGTRAWFKINKSSDSTLTLLTESYPEWTPYQLYYALQEPIQEEIQPIILGDGVNLVEGQNTLTVKSGVVWKKAEPVYNGSTYYGINDSVFPTSKLQYTVGKIIQLMQFKDGEKTIVPIDEYIYTTQAYGNERLRILKEEPLFDINAEHYVLYEVLQEDYNCQVQNVDVSYEDNIRGAVNEAKEEISNNQVSISELQLRNVDTNIKGDGERVEYKSSEKVNRIKTVTFAKAFSDIPTIIVFNNGYPMVWVYTSLVTCTGFNLGAIDKDGNLYNSEIITSWIAIGK